MTVRTTKLVWAFKPCVHGHRIFGDPGRVSFFSVGVAKDSRVEVQVHSLRLHLPTVGFAFEPIRYICLQLPSFLLNRTWNGSYLSDTIPRLSRGLRALLPPCIRRAPATLNPSVIHHDQPGHLNNWVDCHTGLIVTIAKQSSFADTFASDAFRKTASVPAAQGEDCSP